MEAMSTLRIKQSPDAVTTYEVYTTIKEIKKLQKNIPKELVISVSVYMYVCMRVLVIVIDWLTSNYGL